MAEKSDQPIIIKKVKSGGHAHHGGAWKVAYADFVTAMMAFFLLLWLLNATTKEQKEGIAEYFAPTVASGGKGSNSLFGGTTVASKDPSRATGGVSVPMPMQPEAAAEPPEDIDEETLKARLAEREQAQFEQAAAELKQAIEAVPELEQLKDNLLVDQTPEGLRIQLVDRDRLAMFESGSAKPLPHMQRLLSLVTQVVAKLPNRISVSGHTDATPYRGSNGYSNWELSSDRANASRRLLIETGLEPTRLALVQGKAETEPLLVDEPASPRNRRISIVLLHQREVEAAVKRGLTVPRSTAPPAQSLRPPTGVMGEAEPAGAAPAR